MAAIFDLGVLLVLLISAGVAFFRGFIREVLTIVGVIGGALAALMFGKSLSPTTRGWFGIVEGEDPGKFMEMIPKELAADFTAYAIIFLAVFIILQLASHFFSMAVAAVGLGPVDRTLGVAFGIARGLLFLGIIFMLVQKIGILEIKAGNDKEETYREKYFSSSKTLFYIEGTADWLSGFLPDSEKSARETTSDKLKAIGVLNSNTPSAEAATPPESEGYDTKERNSLDGLIEKQVPAEKTYND
jgi:membrane protein required for colicin V production